MGHLELPLKMAEMHLTPVLERDIFTCDLTVLVSAVCIYYMCSYVCGGDKWSFADPCVEMGSV